MTPADPTLAVPVLVFDGVRLGETAASRTARAALDLVLPPGGLVLVDAGGPETERVFVDTALGLVPPRDGTVRMLGHAWLTLPTVFANALRGRVGLIPQEGAWLVHLPTAADVLLRPRYHRRTPTDILAEDGRRLATRFFLPGLPLDPIAAMHPRDRLRAACVRAFVGEPTLVIVETPFETAWGSLVEPLVASLQEVRERGGAVLWCLTDDPLFDDATLPADRRLRLREALRNGGAA